MSFLASSAHLCSLTFVTVLKSMAVQTVPPLRNLRRSSTFPEKLSQVGPCATSVVRRRLVKCAATHCKLWYVPPARVLNDDEPVALRSQLSYNHGNITLLACQSNHLCLPRPRINHGKRAYTYRAVSLYNRHVIINGAANLSGPMLKRHIRQVLSNSDV